MFQTSKTLAALVASAAIVASSTSLAVAAPNNYQPLPELPSSTVRATTQGAGQSATSIADAIMKDGSDPVAPQGVNDWTCKPSAEKPNPVVLIHGMFMTANTAWAGLGPELKNQGYCVYAVNLPKDPDGLMSKAANLVGLDFGGLSDIDAATVATAAFVNEVLKTTHAKKVDLVSWSQGGLIVDTYLHYFGGADAKNPAKNKVGHSVSIAGAHHGSTLSGAGAALAKVSDIPGAEAPLRKVLDDLAGKAAFPMLPNSVLVADMLARGDTLPGVNYTIISSEYDTMITPIENTWMKAVPGATVTNVNLQKGCPNNHSDHHAIVFDPRAWDYTLIGLGTKGVTPRCVTTHPMIATGF